MSRSDETAEDLKSKQKSSKTSSDDENEHHPTDPFDILVDDPSDVIGLISYSIYRNKKKNFLLEEKNLGRRLIFDVTAIHYREELRDQAISWFNKFNANVERESRDKHMRQMRSYMDARLKEIISNTQQFPWLHSISSNIFATLVFAALITVLVFWTPYLSYFNPLSPSTDIQDQINKSS